MVGSSPNLMWVRSLGEIASAQRGAALIRVLQVSILLIQITARGGTSEKESNLLPFGSSAKTCFQTMGQLSPRIAQGDMMIIRVDVSHLLKDPKIPAYDIQRLSTPHNYFEAHFSNPDAFKVLSEQSRIFGPKNDKMEYIYVVQATNPGKTEFSTSRRYSVVTGQHEMGTQELGVVKLMIDFKKFLIEHGAETPSFEEYMKFRLPPSGRITAKIYAEMSNGEEKKPYDERLALAEERIESWRKSLSKPIYSDFKVYGNHVPIEVTRSERGGVTTGQIHQLRFNQLPSNLDVTEGDIIAVETIRPKEVVTWEGGHGYPPGAYAHRYDAPAIQGNGLRRLYTETLERASLPNDRGSNHLKVYFLVESSNPASISVGKPKISHPYTPNQRDEWAREIRLNVKPRTEIAGSDATASSNAVSPPVLRELSELDASKLYSGSPLGKSDAKAISDYYVDLKETKNPSKWREAALIEVLRPFFGENKDERVFFLSRSGLKPDEIQRAIAEIDFSAPNAQFFPRLIEVLGPEAGIARIVHGMTKLQL